jgi:catechol 2,3-dioxygenase-like lactoylglutathione lyase family enzyme
MNITIHASFLPHNDPDASLAFYRDTLGFEVRNDVGFRPSGPTCRLPSAGMGEMAATGQLVARGPAAAFVLDDDQVAVVGEGAKRFPVVASINGYQWRTTVTRMKGEFLVGLNREVRDGAGVEAGDTVALALALDKAPREVEVPEALVQALNAEPEARAAFEALAFSHRKEFARWIAEATREETRARRVAQAVEMILGGQTRS